MVNTIYQHRDGCGSDAVAHPNRLTLLEAGLLYEGVANRHVAETDDVVRRSTRSWPARTATSQVCWHR
jgi:hypothetical protein